jgi:hypothetical protein
MFDLTKANAELRTMFADACERFPDMDKVTLWATCKATVAALSVMDAAIAKRRENEPEYVPSPQMLAYAFGRAAEEYIPGAKR